jgi:hypothetical protein
MQNLELQRHFMAILMLQNHDLDIQNLWCEIFKFSNASVVITKAFDDFFVL